MTDANNRQVGGDHYKTAYEHWDFVEDVGMGYLDAVALKYVARWRKKNGLQDLQKADHYIEKLIQVKRPNKTKLVYSLINNFIKVNSSHTSDGVIMLSIIEWQTEADLRTIRDLIKELMLRHPDGTPLTDSNRHAR